MAVCECAEANSNDVNYEDTLIADEDDIIYINASGKKVAIKENTELDIINVEISNDDENKNSVLDSSDDNNNRNREYEAMAIIKSTINMLSSQLEFLKEEIREKNILIKILNHRNANDGRLVDIDMIEGRKTSAVETTSTFTSDFSKSLVKEISCNNQKDDRYYDDGTYHTRDLRRNEIVEYDTSDDDFDETQLKVYQLKQKERLQSYTEMSNHVVSREDPSEGRILSSTPRNLTIVDNSGSSYAVTSEDDLGEIYRETYTVISEVTSEDDLGDISKESSDPSTYDHLSSINELFEWQKHSSGAAAKIMYQMGYKGKGLGKRENGITESISIQPKIFIDKKKEEKRQQGVNDNMKMKKKKKKTKKEECKPTERKRLYVLSDSMLNQMKSNLLSKHLDVTVDFHGGCTLKCMYTHLAPVLIAKPEYIMLHVGTNDCDSKTSDEVLRELSKLSEYINLALPDSHLIISLPTMRTDNNRANTIIRNLKLKAKSLKYTLLENSNIMENDLGNKGLHFNGRGIRKMARNIIALTKQL